MTDDRASVAITMRPAQRSDVPAIVDAVYTDPEPALVRFFGSRELARAAGAVLISHGLEISLPHATVASTDGRVVAVMESGTVRHRTPPLRVASALPPAIRLFGPRLAAVLWRMRHRARVAFDPVPGAYPVGALYTGPAHRNLGIGRTLLAEADRRAADGGRRLLSIETGIDNPARRLYERHGFRLREEKRHAGYQRTTGSPGRVLMVKALE
jgi:GNAT superfamily N-acetyltransferase